MTAWITAFWGAYFIEKEKIEHATCAADFAAIDFNANPGEPPFSMKELSLEAAELYAEAALGRMITSIRKTPLLHTDKKH